MTAFARSLAVWLALATCCLPALARARWPDGGYPVTATPTSENLAAVVSLPGGGSGGSELALWAAGTAGRPALCWANVYAGSTAWAAETLATSPGGSLSDVAAAFTGAGGWPADTPWGVLVAWREARGGTTSVRLTRLLGIPGAFPDTGLVVTHQVPDDATLTVVGDAFGGGVVSWIDRRTGAGVIYAQRYDTFGVAQWAADGVRVAPTTASQGHLLVVPDAYAGGALFAWLQGEWLMPGEAVMSVAAQHLGADGLPAAGWSAAGNTLLGPWYGMEPQYEPFAAVSDQVGGIVVVCPKHPWAEGPAQIVAQRLTSGGVRPSGWPAGGLAVSSGTAAVFQLAATAEPGGFMVAWNDERDEGCDLWAQQVGYDGVRPAGWDAAGKLVVTAGGQPYLGTLRPFGGGVAVGWEDPSAHATCVQLMQLDGQRDPRWPAGGVAVVPSAGGVPLLGDDGVGDLFVNWTDWRTWTIQDPNVDVYVQIVNPAGVTSAPVPVPPNHLELTAPWPDPGAGPMRCELALAAPARAEVEVLDPSGRRVRTLFAGPAGAGTLRLAWDGRDARGRAVPPGVLFVCARTPAGVTTRRFVHLR